MPYRMLRVEAPHFVAGEIWRRWAGEWTCVKSRTEPILQWWAERSQEDVISWLEKKQYTYTWSKPEIDDMSEKEIEAEIQAKNLNAPRMTPEAVDAVIVGETYTALPSGKAMVCELTLKNGFSVRGDGAAVSKANFDEDIGRKISRENARKKVWELEGYLLQQRIFESNTRARSSRE